MVLHYESDGNVALILISCGSMSSSGPQPSFHLLENHAMESSLSGKNDLSDIFEVTEVLAWRAGRYPSFTNSYCKIFLLRKSLINSLILILLKSAEIRKIFTVSLFFSFQISLYLRWPRMKPMDIRDL